VTPLQEQTTTKSNHLFLSNRIWMILSGVLFIALLIYIFVNPPGADRSEAVATINGVDITKDQLYEVLAAAGGAQTIGEMIDTELVRQEVDKAGIKVSAADIEDEMDYIKSMFGSNEEFENAMAMYGLTLEQLEADTLVNVQIRKLLEPQVSVTDEEIQAYYDENLEDFTTAEQVKAAHILLATKDEAEAVRVSLVNGGDFAALAAEKSIDETTKDAGGELALIARGDGEEAFEDAVFALEVGKLSEVVETSQGFHVIKLSERHAESVPTLDEVKEEIIETLISSKISELSITWIEEKRAEATIVNTFEAEQE
jgi:foldase protein PrsA